MKKTTVLTIAAMLLAPLASLHAVEVTNLRCEYLRDPLGLDVVKPRLSWVIEERSQKSEVRGQKQVAYQVLVASSEELLKKDTGDLWDSGKVESDQSIHVEYKGKALESRMSCYWKVRVWTTKATESGDASLESKKSSGLFSFFGRLISRSDEGEVWSQPATWTMGLLDPAGWGEAKWIQLSKAAVTDTNLYLPNIAPWFRKTFELKASPDSALVHLNISGYAELYVNGRKVGEDVLTPAVFNAEHRTFYVTYDVRKFLWKGKNVVAVWLGRGWAQGVPAIRAQLDARIDGETFLLETDSTWKCRESNYRYIGKWNWNCFGGERMDMREQVEGWNLPDLNDSAWLASTEVPGPKVPAVAHPCPLNRIGSVIPAVTVTTISGNRYVIDFGTALTGWLRLKMPRLAGGQLVKLSFADALNTAAKRGNDGYQTFSQVSEFISAGREGEVFENKFNYAGFRYVIVEGLPSAPAREDATAMLIESDLESAGSFDCSKELFNRIHRLTHWTQRCLNLGGYYVDCPHRERLGYGDGQVATEGFMSNFRADGYYRKWLADWRLRQGADGSMPNVAPTQSGGGGPGWAGLLAATTWRHYLYYGDRSVLEENYDAIRRYVDWLEKKCKDDVLRQYGGQWSFIGDWVPPERGMDTKNWPNQMAAELFNNGYRLYQWGLLAKMAAVLDDRAEIERYLERMKTLRPAVHNAFYNATNETYVIDEQAYYVMPLMTDVVPEALQPPLLKKLEANILEKNKGHLDTGMLGTYFLMEYLREIGRNDLVFTMFNQTTYPSWGYMLEKGATTCWEQWNGYWSHIHSCFTSADNWFYQGLGGILPDPVAPGFKKSIIKPVIVGDVTWVKCHHDSSYGRIVSNWKREGGTLTMEVVIPPNTTATVHVPAKDAAAVTEGGSPIDKVQGVKFLRLENGAAVYEVGSGQYRFSSVVALAQSGSVLAPDSVSAE